MNKNKILYKIKSLEKSIIRNFIKDINVIEKEKPTLTQIQIIDCILNTKDKEVYQRDLEKILNLRRATVSGVLQTMEKNNLIYRETGINDIKSKKVKLTDKALNHFNCFKNKEKTLEKILKKDISDNELNIFFKVISKMEDNLNNLKEE